MRLSHAVPAIVRPTTSLAFRAIDLPSSTTTWTSLGWICGIPSFCHFNEVLVFSSERLGVPLAPGERRTACNNHALAKFKGQPHTGAQVGTTCMLVVESFLNFQTFNIGPGRLRRSAHPDLVGHTSPICRSVAILILDIWIKPLLNQ